MRVQIGILFAALTWILVDQVAAACSLSPGAFLQSNFELVDSSDAIVVAEAVSDRPNDSMFGGDVSFRVVNIYKGAPSEEVYASGVLGDPIPSEPSQISYANEEAFMGPCHRWTYELGGQYVLFLKRNEENKYRVAGDPFSRRSEDFFGDESAWIVAIKTYLEIQADPDRLAQMVHIANLVQRGSEEHASKIERIIGQDAFTHLSNVHPDKPTQWLIDLYNSTDPVVRRHDDTIRGTPEESAGQIVDLVFGARNGSEVPQSMILRALSVGNHIGARPIFEDVIGRASPDPTEYGASIAFLIRQGEFDLVKRSLGEKLLWMEAISDPGDGPGFWDSIWPVIGYGDNRKVPAEFHDWLMSQRFAICVLKQGPQDCGGKWDDAADLLNDPERNQVQLMSIAKNPLVIEWAETKVQSLQAGGIDLIDDDWSLPLRILLNAYDRAKPSIINELACSDRGTRESLAHHLGDVPSRDIEMLIFEMMSIDQHEYVRVALLKSAIRHAADEVTTFQRMQIDNILAYANSEKPLVLDHNQRRILLCADNNESAEN